MKSFAVLLFILQSITAASQKKDTISYYVNGDGKPTEYKLATYLRVGIPTDTIWRVYDFYLVNNQPRMKSWSIDDSLKILHGPSEYYFKTGLINAKGSYNKGKKTGLWKWFHESGKLNDSTIYKNDIPVGKSIRYFENGTISNIKLFDNEGRGEGTSIHYYPSGFVRDSGSCLNNCRNGTWLFYREDKTKASEILFAKDSAVGGKNFDASGKLTSQKIIEQEAAYPGGDNAWNQYLIDKISAVSRKKDYADYVGSCMIQFIVEKDGTITTIEAVQGTNQILIKYISDFLRKSRKWDAAIQFNLPVKAYRIQRFTITPQQ
jgi:antitoxin component YwqK of YwqJK toxin-antitoxin module